MLSLDDFPVKPRRVFGIKSEERPLYWRSHTPYFRLRTLCDDGSDSLGGWPRSMVFGDRGDFSDQPRKTPQAPRASSDPSPAIEHEIPVAMPTFE